MAELGINIMTRECLNRRIPSVESLRSELKSWNEAYDKEPSPINWQFEAKDAKIKLKRRYPNIDKCKADREELRKSKQKPAEGDDE